MGMKKLAHKTHARSRSKKFAFHAVVLWGCMCYNGKKSSPIRKERKLMLLCDTHADTLYRRAKEPAAPLDVTLEGLKKGGVNVQTMAMYVGGKPDLALMRENFDLMEKEILRLKEEGWKQLSDCRDAKENESAFLLSVEGCDLLADGLSLLDTWREMGVRMAALTWNHENCIATPASFGPEKGLKPFGREAVKKMKDLGIAVDVSHLNVQGFYDLLDMGILPLASHSCCTALCDHRRNLTDDQLQALFAAGGYVGVNFYPHFLKKGGDAGIADICDHVMHMISLGGEDHIGFGSDFDGIEVKPRDMQGPVEFPLLLDALRSRGLTETQLAKIAGKNLLAYYDRIDPR